MVNDNQNSLCIIFIINRKYHMIRLKDLLKEMSQKDANVAAMAAVGAESIEDISFRFKSSKAPTPKGVLLHEIITIEAFNLPDKENITFQPYHLVFGETSLAIFDAFGVNETAGLNRNEAKAHIEKLAAEGKTEKMDGAYIAGLTNWAGSDLYCFYNAGRISFPGYANRVLAHESLHLARNLITIEANEYIRMNQGKGEWWADERAKWVQLGDDNEEYFAETLERVNAIAYNRWDKIQGIVTKDQSIAPLKAGEYKSHNA